MSRPLFGTGLARSGGGLYSMCLSTHAEIMVACCPNLELFRSFRNAVLREDGRLSPKAPLQDYYGTDDRIRMLDRVLNATLDIPFDAGEWPELYQRSVSRGDLECADLTPHFARLKDGTYLGLFRNLLDIIGSARGVQSRSWVGLHEAWALDSFAALARAFPDARFLIMLRDPRAIVHSAFGVAQTFPEQAVQALSYARHWRKYAALAHRFSTMPLFRGRLHVTAHDLVLAQPRETLGGICDFLDVDFDERLLDTGNYFNFATGTIWGGNSGFEEHTSGISLHRALRWREKMAPHAVAAMEYLCGPELRLVGYPSFTPFADSAVDADGAVTEFLLQDMASSPNWRSDLGDPLADLGLEAVRRQLLRLAVPARDVSLVRRAFLFEETYEALRESDSPLLPALGVVLSPARSC